MLSRRILYASCYQEEYDMLKTAGWIEGDVKWYAPATGDPVYRLYNPNVSDLKGNLQGDYYYTTNIYEVRWKAALLRRHVI